jgi:aspartate racemase
VSGPTVAMSASSGMIGVIGGMGPLATADFFAKVVAAVPACGDDDHVPLLIHSVPQLPARPAAILAGGASPLPHLLAARDRLLAAGAVALAMPCNTAHYWFDALVLDCPVPFLHIVDAVCGELKSVVAPGSVVGLIATRATLVGRVYDDRLQAAGYRIVLPDDAALEQAVLPAILKVKQGDATAAGRMLEPVIDRVLDAGAQAVVLACTELPLALSAAGSPLATRCVDSNLALARACVQWWNTHAPSSVRSL